MILNDADRLLRSCEGSFDEINQYQLLIRVIREQTIREKDGALRFRTKMDGGMDSNVLQNPSDPEATYREKAGKQNRGYAANVTESVGENGSIMGNKKAVVHVSAKSSEKAKIQRTMNTETFRIIARIRNGVETIPSILRR